VPASLKLQETYGDDLQVIFVESQGATPTQAEGFSLAHRWLGGRAMWTSEHPFESGATSLPFFVLVGDDGRVLMKGNPLAQPKEIERQIAEAIQQRKSAPDGAPKELEPAWTEFNRGRYARAFERLRATQSENADQLSVTHAARQAEQEFRGRIEKELARVRWMLDNGYFGDAAVRVDELSSSLKGEDDLAARCVELAREIDAPERKSERDSAQALARLLPDFFKKGGDATTTAELLRFADKYRGTQAAARAAHLAKLPRS
jgi:hypothetical protein